MEKNKPDAPITVTVVYVTNQVQQLIEVKCHQKETLEQVVIRSGLCEKYHDIQLQDDLIGIFGEQKKLSDTVADQDRVEIYRPLRISPTQARQLRAKAKAKTNKK